tara:strand:+ start:186 stop:377 length:192 start_codon:yes stop_codon:yes gene_type:complete
VYNNRILTKTKGLIMKNQDSRYEKQFEFAKKVWETSTGQKYSGSYNEKLEIERNIELIKKLVA